ncbi:ligand of Numb protein X 2 isoform X2 [Homo sapiens]|uniref:ligand of Numb protein X 2 isoform X2 n=1 Tax=Homo sapiens TaxID=9606 RepID=UPI000387B985|nr:ligand of Numb protein X 2 isoform X2 [Homo sapiens]XP_047286107.1 ligand of Numb protein X 2 isoform X2 [Homo sapiens]|eukprot:XP_011533297.1 ligand of Numb protein X 2 isoform X2 [Homo sapiens]
MGTTSDEMVSVEQTSSSSLNPLCFECGQQHWTRENHLYNYQNEVDDDLVCHICLQPLLQPLDTPCGHTFCYKCLRNFLQEKDFCPLDRKRLHFKLCKKSSILVHKLLDKLLVLCPFSSVCKDVMQRCDLEAHLKNRCPGASHRRVALERRKTSRTQAEIENENGPTLLDPAGTLSPEADCLGTGAVPVERHLTSASLSTWSEEPGLDNPAFEESAGADTTQQPLSLPEGEITTIEIHRSNPYIQLGISIVGGNETPLINIVIQEVYRDGVIARDGRLLAGDQILQASGERVNLTIARPGKPQPGNTIREAGNHSSSSQHHTPPPYYSRPSSHKDLTQCVTCQEKHITVKKEPHESLGMTVAGGRGSKSGELPIFVTSVPPHGCLARDGRIKRGDVLLNINGIDLTNLSHSEAVAMLKASAASPAVALKALEVQIVEEATQNAEEQPSTFSENEYDASWSPSWVMWLGLPSTLHSCHDIVLRRSYLGSWGFSIVGGYEENHTNQPFFIKTIVLGTPAYYDGRLKCGDMIVAVNGLSTVGMSHSALVPMLKEQRNKVTLTVICWPGSLV